MVRQLEASHVKSLIHPAATPTVRQLPLSSDGVLTDERIGCEQDTIVFDRLADQHPIEGIAVQCGKLVQVKHRPLFQR